MSGPWVSGICRWSETMREGNGNRTVYLFRGGPEIGDMNPGDPGWYARCGSCRSSFYDPHLMREAAADLARHFAVTHPDPLW